MVEHWVPEKEDSDIPLSTDSPSPDILAVPDAGEGLAGPASLLWWGPLWQWSCRALA